MLFSMHNGLVCFGCYFILGGGKLERCWMGTVVICAIMVSFLLVENIIYSGIVPAVITYIEFLSSCIGTSFQWTK